MHDTRPESQSPNDRGQWGSNLGFVLAAAGSAIGLGNIWRFPRIAAQNGGGSFLIAWLIFLRQIAVDVVGRRGAVFARINFTRCARGVPAHAAIGDLCSSSV